MAGRLGSSKRLGDDYLSLHGRVIEELRQAILSRRLKPGERLVEGRLADELGVSRNPVREAIRVLESEGLVEVTARRGASVITMGDEEARETVEVRALLEARERASHELEALVVERTSELEKANQELRTQMAERTRIEETLRQAQKIEAIGQLTGGIAHDFNNLLMVISGGLDMLDRRADPARRERLMAGMRQAAQRGTSLTRQLLAFSRRQSLAPESVDLVLRIGRMRELLDRSLSGDVHVQVRAPGA